MDSLSWIGLATLFVTGICYAIYAAIHVGNRDTIIHTKIGALESAVYSKVASVEVQIREKIENTYNLAVTKQESAFEREAKARHDLANEMQRGIGQLVIDDKALASRINDLSADMVRKSDLAAHEARMTSVLQNIQTSLQNAVERLDGKVDELRDRIHG
jgi:hypothetical protein